MRCFNNQIRGFTKFKNCLWWLIDQCLTDGSFTWNLFPTETTASHFVTRPQLVTSDIALGLGLNLFTPAFLEFNGYCVLLIMQIYIYSFTKNSLSPVPVSDWLIFCWGNLILHQKRNKNDKYTISFHEKQLKNAKKVI